MILRERTPAPVLMPCSGRVPSRRASRRQLQMSTRYAFITRPAILSEPCATKSLRLETFVPTYRHAENNYNRMFTYSRYEGESRENLKYVLSRNLLNTKVHSSFNFLSSLHCHLSATLQTMSITVVNLKTTELCFDFLSQF